MERPFHDIPETECRPETVKQAWPLLDHRYLLAGLGVGLVFPTRGETPTMSIL
ncbi:MAG: hypothetical protein ACKOC1_02880 [Hyphomicrobiales bacterium]